MPCRWFMGFVERQAPRSYRTVVCGWTPLSQKPSPRRDAQTSTLYNVRWLGPTLRVMNNWFTIESPLKRQLALPAPLAPSTSHNHKIPFTTCWVTPILQTPKNTSLRPSPNERTCMGWHKRYAMTSVVARGAFTSRGAEPNGLNFMLRDSKNKIYRDYISLRISSLLYIYLHYDIYYIFHDILYIVIYIYIWLPPWPFWWLAYVSLCDWHLFG